MTKSNARVIANLITNEQLVGTFKAAKVSITNWDVPSVCNKGLSKGIAWNILASDFDVSKEYNSLAKTNMVREFSDFIPDYLKPKKKEPKPDLYLSHQIPNFKNYE
jgi:hypothetical protein